MSDKTSKYTNSLKIVKLLDDVGTETVRGLFYHFKPRDRVTVFFQSQTICDELAVLKRQHKLSREQYNRLVFDPSPDPEEFDLVLLLTLVTNLFKPTIDIPTHGLDTQVAEDDTTLDADLLRLKDIRNKIVGLRPKAELSSNDFEELWKQSECVMIRITELFDSTKKEEITSKINECKASALDESSERKYLSLLYTWHGENITLLSHLQNEVDMLCKKAEGFDIFFANKIPERFLRYILLLCEGGLLVLAGIMKRELEKHQTSLSDILLQNKDTLAEYNQSAASLIFSADDCLTVTDISLWGTKLLSYVILMLFHASLSSMEQTAVAVIGSASNDYGKVAMESLDSDKFRSCWTDIVHSINNLANGLSSKTQLESLMLIKKHDTEEVDEISAKQYLMQLGTNCKHLQSLVEQYIDLREKLKDALEQVPRECTCFGKDQGYEDDCGITSNFGLQFRCSSVNAIENVRASLQRNETFHSINQIAQVLPEQLNENISIRTSSVAGGVSDIYKNPLITISQSPWAQFVSPSDAGLPEHVPDFSHLHHLRSILDELKDSQSKGSSISKGKNMYTDSEFSPISSLSSCCSIVSESNFDLASIDLDGFRVSTGESPCTSPGSSCTSEELIVDNLIPIVKQSTVNCASFEHQSQKVKHVAGPAINWDEYDIPKKKP